ncbi:MAG: SseB family protein [Elusimicrobia bacterium]|nr:SseB family protein [Elusimicrobiota bacterium]
MDLPDNQRLRACLGRPRPGEAGRPSPQVYEELLRARLIVPVQLPQQGAPVGLMFTRSGGRTGLPVFTNPEEMKKTLPPGMEVMAFDARVVFQMASAAEPRIDSIMIDPYGAGVMLERSAFQALAAGAIPGAPAPGAESDAPRYLPMPPVGDDVLSALKEAGASRPDIDSCWLFCVEKGGRPHRTIGFEVSGLHGSECVQAFMALGPVRRALVRCGVSDAVVVGPAIIRELQPVALEVFRRSRAAPAAAAAETQRFSAAPEPPSDEVLAPIKRSAAGYPALKSCWLFMADAGRGPRLTVGFDAPGREGLAAARAFWELPEVHGVMARLGVEEVMVLSPDELARVVKTGFRVFRRGWFGL